MPDLDSSKLKEFSDDNIQLVENGLGFSKRGESTVEKGEISRYEHFFPFPTVFQKICTADTEKPRPVWERIKSKNKKIQGRQLKHYRLKTNEELFPLLS